MDSKLRQRRRLPALSQYKRIECAQDVQFLCKLAAVQASVLRGVSCVTSLISETLYSIWVETQPTTCFVSYLDCLFLLFFTLLCFSLLILSLSLRIYLSLFLCCSQFSTFRIYLVLEQNPSHLARYEHRRVRTHSSGLLRMQVCNNAWYSEKFYSFISSQTRGFKKIEILLNLNKIFKLLHNLHYFEFLNCAGKEEIFACSYFLNLFSFNCKFIISCFLYHSVYRRKLILNEEGKELMGIGAVISAQIVNK